MSARPKATPETYDLDRETLERCIDLADGVNPFRFLKIDDPSTAIGIIRGIDSVRELKGWRLANQSFFDPPRRRVTEALDAREASLTGEDDLHRQEQATDTCNDSSDTDQGSGPNVPIPAPEPTFSPHPEANLEPNEAVCIHRGDRSEYVITASVDADEPYISQTLEDGDQYTWCALSNDELLRRLTGDHERIALEDAPTIVQRASEGR